MLRETSEERTRSRSTSSAAPAIGEPTKTAVAITNTNRRVTAPMPTSLAARCSAYTICSCDECDMGHTSNWVADRARAVSAPGGCQLVAQSGLALMAHTLGTNLAHTGKPP